MSSILRSTKVNNVTVEEFDTPHGNKVYANNQLVNMTYERTLELLGEEE